MAVLGRRKLCELTDQMSGRGAKTRPGAVSLASSASPVSSGVLAKPGITQRDPAPSNLGGGKGHARQVALAPDSPHLGWVKWQWGQRCSRAQMLLSPGAGGPLGSPPGHLLGTPSRAKGRVRGSPPQAAGQSLVPCKVALEKKLGGGLLGSRLKVDARCQGSGDLGGLSVPGLGKEEGPALPCRGLPLPKTPIPSHCQKETPPPRAAPKIAPAATSVVTGTCHSHQEARCSPGTVI